MNLFKFVCSMNNKKEKKKDDLFWKFLAIILLLILLTALALNDSNQKNTNVATNEENTFLDGDDTEELLEAEFVEEVLNVEEEGVSELESSVPLEDYDPEWTCEEKFAFYSGKLFKYNFNLPFIDTRAPDETPSRDILGDFPTMGYVKGDLIDVYSDLEDKQIKIFKSLESGGMCWVLAEAIKEDGENPDIWFKEDQFCGNMDAIVGGSEKSIENCAELAQPEPQGDFCFTEENVESNSECTYDSDVGCPMKDRNGKDQWQKINEDAKRKCANILSEAVSCSENCCSDSELELGDYETKKTVINTYVVSGDNCYYCAENAQWIIEPINSDDCGKIKTYISN